MAVRGGDKFAAELQRMAGAVSSAQSVKVGFLAGATYPDGKPVALIAAIQNWGAPAAGIPPRAFFSNMIRKKQHEWGPATADLLKANAYDAHETLRTLGEAVVGQLRQSIQDTNDPPLAPSTIKRKGFSKPLIGGGITGGHMYNSADYEVKAK